MSRIEREGRFLTALVGLCWSAVLWSDGAHAAAGADLVLLRDGSRRSGHLAACVGERCSLDRDWVARADIAWIGLAVADTASPPPRSNAAGGGDELYLVDGTSRRGAFEGLSLAEAMLDGQSVARETIRWIRFAGAGAMASDLLVERDGTVTRGTLQGCAGAVCTMGGRATPRETLAWIGLGRDSTASPPSPPADATIDAVQLAGGELEPAPLVGINATSVVTERGSHPRAAVDWIYLAPPARGTGFTPGTEVPEPPGQPETQPPSPASLPPSPPPPPPPIRPPRPRNDPVQACPPGRPLGAWVRLRNDYVDVVAPGCTGSETHLVRFRLEPDPGTQVAGAVVALSYSAKEMRYSVSTAGCFDAPESIGGDPRTVCNSAGMSTDGVAALNPENLGYAKFVPLEPSLSFQYPNAMSPPIRVTAHCVHLPSGTKHDTEAGGFSRVAISARECAYPQRECEAYCVAPTECETSNFANSDCAMHPERFAVIPFAGAIVDGPERTSRGLCITPGGSEIQWRVCCGCAEAGPPPDFPPETPGCPGPTPQRAIMDTLWSQRQQMADQLEPKWRELEEAYEEMQFNLEAWGAAVPICAIYDIVSVLVSRLSGPFGKAVKQANKMAKGDLSYITAGIDDPQQRDYVAAFFLAWKAGTSLRQAGDPAAMRAKLAGCPALSESLRAGANAFVDNYEKVGQLMPGVQELVNQIRGKDQEYWDQWHQYYQACLEWARCAGRPPTDCQEPPAEPSGPMQ